MLTALLRRLSRVRRPQPFRRPAAARRAFVPRLDVLEDRQLLSAGTVTWFPGEVSPGDTVDPASPYPSDVVRFTLHDVTHSNPCFAAGAHGGTPYLGFHDDDRAIDVYFLPPAPFICTLIYAPVTGFQGELTDLTPGEWTLRGPLSSITFTVQTPVTEPISLPFETVDQGQLSYFGDPEDLVILDPATWEAFWAAHTSAFFPPPPLPEIDFESEMLIVTRMGTRSTGGYFTAIQEVIYNPADGSLTVRVHDHSPGPDDPVTLAFTSPYHIVRVQRVDFASVVFEHQDV